VGLPGRTRVADSESERARVRAVLEVGQDEGDKAKTKGKVKLLTWGERRLGANERSDGNPNPP